jgi:multiple sugar transport system permease protein
MAATASDEIAGPDEAAARDEIAGRDEAAARRRPEPRIRRELRAQGLRRAAVGWGFAGPFTALFAVFLLGPVLASLAMSGTDIRSVDVRTPLAVRWVGFANYGRLLHDDLFLRAAGNTAVVVLVGLPLTVALGLAVALGLNSGLVRLRGLFRVGYYLPVVTSIVAISVVWRFVLQPDSGVLDAALGLVGIHGPNWLADPDTALPSVIVTRLR